LPSSPYWRPRTTSILFILNSLTYYYRSKYQIKAFFSIYKNILYIIYITSILGVKNLTNIALSNRLEMLNFKTNKKST